MTEREIHLERLLAEANRHIAELEAQARTPSDMLRAAQGLRAPLAASYAQTSSNALPLTGIDRGEMARGFLFFGAGVTTASAREAILEGAEAHGLGLSPKEEGFEFEPE